MTQCEICSQPVEELLNLGLQPVCHHYMQSSAEDELYPLRVGQCSHCATIQLTERMPLSAMLPRFGWLNCTEPEAHLDDLVSRLLKLPNINPSSRITGVSFKEDSTLARFSRLGYRNTRRLSLKDDLGVELALAGIESVQANLTRSQLNRFIARNGKSDLLIVRHTLEHAYDVQEFIHACKSLLTEDGYLVLEVPDCEFAFRHYDYTVLWEEHTLYFTETSFRNFFNAMNLELIHFEKIPYKHESSYVGIAKLKTESDSKPHRDELVEAELELGKNFSKKFAEKKTSLQSKLASLTEADSKVAIYGAGHMASTFINIMDIARQIECVIDDNQNMKNLYMPGNRLAICHSEEVSSEKIKLALLTVSETSQAKIMAKQTDRMKLYSIFPGSDFPFCY